MHVHLFIYLFAFSSFLSFNKQTPNLEVLVSVFVFVFLSAFCFRANENTGQHVFFSLPSASHPHTNSGPSSASHFPPPTRCSFAEPRRGWHVATSRPHDDRLRDTPAAVGPVCAVCPRHRPLSGPALLRWAETTEHPAAHLPLPLAK